MRGIPRHPTLRSVTVRRGAALAAGLAIAALASAPASAAPPAVPLPDCATPIAPGKLSVGQPAVGFTVRRGELVEGFDVTVLGVMHDALGPGRDLVLVDADEDAPVIREGGISAGMSGSPVYTHDGHLIGAIGYAFSVGATPIGGVTPAADMLRLLDEPARGRSAPATTVPLEGGPRRRARRAGAGAGALRSGLSRLPLPLSVSGLRPERAATLRSAAERQGLPFVVTGGAGPTALASLEPAATVAPGDSFAAALSYGDATLSAIGTTTYVCDGDVLAFGHPFLFTGATLLGASRAWVFRIVDDAFVPYKLASVTEPIGVVDRDRLAAIRGRAGKRIPTMPVTQTTIALDTGQRRIGGRTEIVRAPGQGGLLLPDVSSAHALGNIDVTFDQISGGSSLVSWTLRGKRAPFGQTWRIKRANRFTSGSDISFASVVELWEDLATLAVQRLERVDYEGLAIKVRVEQALRHYVIREVSWATRGKRFRKARMLRVRPGRRIRARVRLHDLATGSAREVEMRFRAPKRRGRGAIRIVGGAGGDSDESTGQEAEDFSFFACAAQGGCADRAPAARSFDRLLARMRARPRNDELVGRIRFRGQGRRAVVRRVRRVVSGRRTVRLVVRARR